MAKAFLFQAKHAWDDMICVADADEDAIDAYSNFGPNSTWVSGPHPLFELHATHVEALRSVFPELPNNGRSVAKPVTMSFRSAARIGISRSINDGLDFIRLGNIADRRLLRERTTTQIEVDLQRPTIRDISDFLEGLKALPGAGRQHIFRGHSRWSWRLLSGFHRMFSNVGASNVDAIYALERSFFEDFKRRTAPFIAASSFDDWEWLCLAQHYGLPTRLLDWTQSPFLALYFALREMDPLEDGVVFAFAPTVSPLYQRGEGSPFTQAELKLFLPRFLDHRVSAQKSLFTLEPNGWGVDSDYGSELSHWHVSGVALDELKVALEQMNITEDIVFPGIESVARELRRELEVIAASMFWSLK